MADLIVAHPDLRRPHHFYTAVSATVVQLLAQTDGHGTDTPIHYLSIDLNDTERKSSTTERKACLL